MPLSPYIYESNISPNSDKVLIVLPDIFGLNQVNKDMMEDFASQTGFSVFGLDYFYQKTGITTDQSISENDRKNTQEILSNQTKKYQQIIYPNAGHAFFNKGRSSFVPEIYEEVVENIKKFLG
jgi:dienelactone hydrolase